MTVVAAKAVMARMRVLSVKRMLDFWGLVEGWLGVSVVLLYVDEMRLMEWPADVLILGGGTWVSLYASQTKRLENTNGVSGDCGKLASGFVI